MLHWKPVALGLISVVAASNAGPVLGAPSDLIEEQVATTSLAFEEIVVTARRVEEGLQKVPVAVTALDAVELANRRITTAIELNAVVPGLHIANYNQPDSLIVGIRGQRTSQIQPGQDPSIGVYFADVPTGIQWGLSLGLFDLASVQVLKGPQGTLFGRNSTGGAILFTPEKPTDRFQGSVRVGAQGWYNGHGFTTTGIANLPIDDELRVRVAVNTVNNGGYLENLNTPAVIAAQSVGPVQGFVAPHGLSTLKPGGSQDSQEWRIGIEWTPAANVENYFIYQGARYIGNGFAPQLTDIGPGTQRMSSTAAAITAQLQPYYDIQKASDNFWSTQSIFNSPTTLTQHQFIDTLTWRFGNITLKNIFGYKTLSRNWAGDFLSAPQITVPFVGLTEAYVQFTQEGEDISEELQISGSSLEGRLSWVAGLFYLQNRIFQDTNGVFVSYSNRSGDALGTTMAGYAQADYALPWVDGLNVTVGVRYTADSRSMTKIYYSPSPTSCGWSTSDPVNFPIPASCTVAAKKNFGQWTYNTTINYQLSDEAMVYAAYSRGYRAGGLNIGENNVANYVKGFRPETVLNHELGLKTDWDMGFPLRSNLAVYLQKYTNIVRQAYDPILPLGQMLINASKATIRGGELEVRAKPFERVELGASYAYTDAYYTAPWFPLGVPPSSCDPVVPCASNPANAFNAINNHLALVPKHQATFTASYLLPVDSRHGAININMSWNIQSRNWLDDTFQDPYFGTKDQVSQKSYSTLDLNLLWSSVEESNFDIALWVKNLANTKYYDFPIPVPNTGFWAKNVGKPRFFGIDVTYHFGN